MKRLMLIGLCLFAAAASSTALGSVELFSIDGGEASWVEDSTAPSGDGLAAKLYWPGPSSNAGVLIDIPDMTIADLKTWSYSTKAPEDYATQLTFYVDHEGVDNYAGKDYDTIILAWPYNKGYGNQWLTVDQDSIHNYVGIYIIWSTIWPEWGRPDILPDARVYADRWSVILNNFSDGIVKRVELSKGELVIPGTGITAYADDLFINGLHYPLVPEPATMVLLGLGGLFLRKRR